ncbi:hypothetical protein [Denitrobaculum tricleocarpae]|uniref:Uncharacterized protein n=1 Tax=Denitrobaculum tricleocarpae TaxID=2591009 RepID=A0A545TQ35_9PROT|nr:hypothetical protein [Denitrobaculum tricleocarpae]TQV79330.1 hypothetical protein FKG95_16935 [Denitrobaculum tricleocarpae]
MAQAVAGKQKDPGRSESGSYDSTLNPIEPTAPEVPVDPPSPLDIADVTNTPKPRVSGKPAVRHWQENLGASLTEERSEEEEPDRWQPGRSVFFFALISLVLWSVVFAGAFSLSWK